MFVSIPFKREGLSEQTKRRIWHRKRRSGFNSLQTGRTFRTSIPGRNDSLYVEAFQFPSNGKDFPNGRVTARLPLDLLVSIPFKREGLSEHGRQDAYTITSTPGFQFPSNGKDFPNAKFRERLNATTICFNSLQTGRTFRTLKFRKIKFSVWNGFNSLQTGRTFRTY